MLKLGLSCAEAENFLESYNLPRRSVERQNDLPDPVLRELFAWFDVSAVEVGMVTFNEAPEHSPQGHIIGTVEADPMVLDSSSGEIFALDLADTSYRMWRCAKSGASLLAALGEAAAYLSSCIAEDHAGSELERQTLHRCVKLAGGEDYDVFYRTLLGAWTEPALNPDSP